MGERLQFHREQLNGDGRRKMPHGAPRGGMHKADEVAPVIAMLDGGNGALARERPHSVQNRLEPNAVFIDRPELNGRVRVGRRDIAQERAEMLLEVRLGLRIGLHMARAGHTQPGAQAPQDAPARLPAHPAPEAGADPGGHRAPAPMVALGMRAGHGCAQLPELGVGQVWPPRTRGLAPVSHAVRAGAVVAPGNLADPVR
jgi:hypothetical protein